MRFWVKATPRSLSAFVANLPRPPSFVSNGRPRRRTSSEVGRGASGGHLADHASRVFGVGMRFNRLGSVVQHVASAARGSHHVSQRRLVVAFLAWLAVFGAGMAIPSKPFRDLLVSSCFALSEHPAEPLTPAPAAKTPWTASLAALFAPRAASAPAAEPIQAPPKSKPRILEGWTLALLAVPLMVVILITFTPTNLLLLTVFGALLGAYVVQRWDEARRERLSRGGMDASAVLPQQHKERVYATTAVVCGLCVFLGVAAGFIVIQGEVKWDTDRPDLYLRLAAFATLFAIVSGANPDFMKLIVARFRPFNVPDSNSNEASAGSKPDAGSRATDPGHPPSSDASVATEVKSMPTAPLVVNDRTPGENGNLSGSRT